MELEAPFSFSGWVESNKEHLKPPVCNKLVFGEQLKVQVVGGPNRREDYHLEEGEELFYQLKGFMDLYVIDPQTNKQRAVRIEEGHMFLLPANVMHNPVRYANTVGLVVERERGPDEYDALRWFVDPNNCSPDSDPLDQPERPLTILHEEYFHCTDLGTQLKPVIERYFASEAYKSRVPGADMPVRNPPCVPVSVGSLSLEAPFPFMEAVNAEIKSGQPSSILGDASKTGEFEVIVFKGCSQEGGAMVPTTAKPIQQVFLWALHGDAEVHTGSTSSPKVTRLREGDAIYLNLSDVGGAFALQQPEAGAGDNDEEPVTICVFNQNFYPKPC